MDLSDSDMGPKKDDMRHGHFKNSTGERGNLKRQQDAILTFVKIGK